MKRFIVFPPPKTKLRKRDLFVPFLLPAQSFLLLALPGSCNVRDLGFFFKEREKTGHCSHQSGSPATFMAQRHGILGNEDGRCYSLELF